MKHLPDRRSETDHVRPVAGIHHYLLDITPVNPERAPRIERRFKLVECVLPAAFDGTRAADVRVLAHIGEKVGASPTIPINRISPGSLWTAIREWRRNSVEGVHQYRTLGERVRKDTQLENRGGRRSANRPVNIDDRHRVRNERGRHERLRIVQGIARERCSPQWAPRKLACPVGFLRSVELVELNLVVAEVEVDEPQRCCVECAWRLRLRFADKLTCPMAGHLREGSIFSRHYEDEFYVARHGDRPLSRPASYPIVVPAGQQVGHQRRESVRAAVGLTRCRRRIEQPPASACAWRKFTVTPSARPSSSLLASAPCDTCVPRAQG